jgi:O-antigen ligase
VLSEATRPLAVAAGRLGGRRPAPEILLLIFAFLILSGPPRLRTRDLQAALQAPLSLDPAGLLQVFAWLGAAAVVAYLLVVYELHGNGLLRQIMRDPPLGWYLGFALLGIASAAWSPSPLYTVFFAGKLVIGTLAVVLLADYGRHARISRAINVLFAVYAAKLVALVLLFIVNPSLVYQAEFPGQELAYPRLAGGAVLEDYGTSPLFTGVMLLTLAVFGSGRSKRAAALLGYLVTWVFLLLSQTRTAIILAFVFLILLVSQKRSSRGAGVLAIAGVAVLGLSLFWKQAEFALQLATRGGEGIETLSGRTVAFDYLMERWRESPINGLGYGAGTRTVFVDFVSSTGLAIGSGHDVLSTVLVDLGIVGAAVLGLVFLTIWRRVLALWLNTRRLSEHRITVIHLTCFAVWMTVNCFVGPSLAAVAPPFLVLIGTAWALRRTLISQSRPPAEAREAS